MTRSYDTCLVCSQKVKVVTWQHSTPLTPFGMSIRTHIFVRCLHCETYEEGYEENQNSCILRIGVSITRAANPISYDLSSVSRITLETRELIKDRDLHAFIRSIGVRPDDNAIYVAMLDWMEENGILDRYPLTKMILRIRCERGRKGASLNSGQS